MSPRILQLSLILLLASFACSETIEGTAAADHESGGLADRELQESQSELLQIAFDASSKMPLNPHLKNRARGQAIAVEAAIELEQFQTAYDWAHEIPNWRRGAAYADLAMARLQLDPAADVQPLLDEALEVADGPAAETVDQEWRRDRVRAKVAAAYIVMGEVERAATLAQGIEPSERRYFEGANAQALDAEQAAAQLDAFPELIQSASFEQAESLLRGLALLYEGHYADEGLRERAHALMKEWWTPVPMLVRVELTLDMARAAQDAGNGDHALALLDEARAMTGEMELSPDMYIQLLAEIATVRAEAGDRARALEGLDAAFDLFVAEHSKITNMFRGRALRPVIEGYLIAGATDQAELVLTRCLEEGVENPNSRPRAWDLTETCSLLARHGFEPSEEAWDRIRSIFEELGDPW